MLQINDLVYRIGERMLFDHATVSIPDGARVGLVGRNGTGKTTLLNLVSGSLQPESGSLALNRGARLGRVEQEAPGGETTLLDFVLAADVERATLLEQAEHETDPARISEIQLRLTDIGAHSAPARAGAILSGLGFDADAQARPLSSFSGGWRMRVALAAVLFSEPDLLLLDEPTNYLDLEGTLWLESYLASYPKTMLVVSHDRDLLNKAVGQILHLDAGKLVLYRGGYDEFERIRGERQALQLKLKKKQDDERRHIEEFVERFRAKASKARQAQSRLKALARMQPIAAIVDSDVLPIRFPDPEKELSPPIVRLDEVAVGYAPERPVLKRLTLRIDHDDRIGLLGANGNGKSTFAKLISGRLDPLWGKVWTAPKLSVAFVAQHQVDELEPQRTALQHVRELMPAASEAQVRSRAAQMGFAGRRAETLVANLSGGEKTRLLMGLATFHGPHLLILDEPTNHLDIDSREALVRAVNDYRGAVMIISHDRHLLEATVDRLWLVAEGDVKAFDGDLDDYKRLLLGKAAGGRKAPDKPARAEERGTPPNGANGAARRINVHPLRSRIAKAEAEMAKMNQALVVIDGQLADPKLFERDPAKGAELGRWRAEALKRIASAEAEWMAASEALEKAERVS